MACLRRPTREERFVDAWRDRDFVGLIDPTHNIHLT
jgi:hypothetical protein